MLEARDRSAIRELKRELAVVSVEDRAPLAGILPRLTEVLGAEKGLVYRVRADEDALALDFVIDRGLRRHPRTTFAEEFGATIRSADRIGLYKPTRIDRAQRNAALALPSVRSAIDGSLPALMGEPGVSTEEKSRRLVDVNKFGSLFTRWGSVDDAQLRALVCDGSALLAWVGGFRSVPFDARSTQALRALVPSLRARLKVESQLGALGVAVDPLSRAILEHVAGAGFVVDAHGSIVLANAAARTMLARAPRETRAMLAPTARPRPDVAVTSVALAARGVGPLRLVIVHEEAKRAEHAAQAVAVHHGLTPREAEVLVRLTRGASNLRIAHDLGCAERTVEVHVARVLAKLGCASRAEAIARTLG